MTDHERIWLEPVSDEYGYEGRLWCQDNVWRDNNEGDGVEFIRADIAAAEITRLRALDKEAAQYVESVICLRTGFTGEPPYVGWKGLGLALNEALDERDRLRALLSEVGEALAEIVEWESEQFHPCDPPYVHHCGKIAAAALAKIKEATDGHP